MKSSLRSRSRRVACLSLFSLAFVGLSTSAALADSSIGWVSSPSQTDTTITVNWSPPASPYSHCAPMPTYQMCIKVKNSLPLVCNVSFPASSSPFTYAGLTPNTDYKIQVRAFTKKNGTNCKFREVATIQQATQMPIPPVQPPGTFPPGFAHLSLPQVGQGSFTAVATFVPDGGATPTKVRICYKRSWWPMNLVAACNAPWSVVNPTKGAIEFSPPSGAVSTHTFDNLTECKQYKVVAYGYPGDVILGEGSVHTSNAGGNCPKLATSLTSDFLLSELVSDYQDVAQQYQAATDQHLRSIGKQNGLLDVLAGCDASVPAELQTLADGHETVTTDVDLLDYIHTRGNLLACWQSSPLIPRALTLQSYLSINHPTVLEQIRGELDQPR